MDPTCLIPAFLRIHCPWLSTGTLQVRENIKLLLQLMGCVCFGLWGKQDQLSGHLAVISALVQASLLAEEMRRGSRESSFRQADWSGLSTVSIMSFCRTVTFGVSGRAKLPTEGWVTRHLHLARFGFSKLLSLSFHFIPPEVMHKVHCEINGVLKWLLTMSSYWYVFPRNYSTKYFFPSLEFIA